MTWPARKVRWITTASLLFVLVPASAAGQPQSSPPAQKNANPSASDIAEARRRYELGVRFYDDGNFEAARIEFERAYASAPSYRILYNIALAYRSLNNYVDALKAFERYLVDARNEIAPERRASVEKDIVELKARIGRVRVTADVPGAEILIDGIVVGKAPLSAPVAVNPGLRRISAQAEGYAAASRTVTVGSSEELSTNLHLEKISSTTTIIMSDKSNPWALPTVLGWSATGAAAIGAGVFGVLSLRAKSDQTDKLEQIGAGDPAANRGELDDARKKTQTLAGVTDALVITTAVFAGASIYFTLKMSGHRSEEAEAGKSSAGLRSLRFHVGPGAAFASGTF